MFTAELVQALKQPGRREALVVQRDRLTVLKLHLDIGRAIRRFLR